MSERLQKFLATAGVASRRAAEAMITAGRVSVNGVKITTLGTKVDGAVDKITVDGKPINVGGERSWYLLYKPEGVVTTLTDPQERPTVGHLIQEEGIKTRVYPVGRLDFDAEGALLLTDEGEVAHQLMHPKYQVERTYLVKVKGEPIAATLQRLLDGVRLEDGPAKAKSVRVFDKAEKNTWVEIIVTEGRPHLVKRLWASVGHPVMRLFRPVHAGVPVKGLAPGEIRPLTPEEIATVKSVAAGNPPPPFELALPGRRHGKASPNEGDLKNRGPETR